MVVAAPTGTEGCIDLEHSVHDAKGVTDERVVRATNSITNHFEKTGIHDCVGRKFNAMTGPLVYQDDCSTISILVRTALTIACVTTELAPRTPGDLSPLLPHL